MICQKCGRETDFAALWAMESRPTVQIINTADGLMPIRIRETFHVPLCRDCA